VAVVATRGGPSRAGRFFKWRDSETHLPNIFATKKMTMAPKRPPPPRIYIKE